MAKKLKLNGTVIGDGSSWFYDWIGMPAISPQKVSNFLDEANGEDIEIYVNSGGGLVFSGSEIYTMLKGYSGHVTVYVTGVAASAASVFPMGADRVVMSPTSQMMIHNSSSSAWGDKNDISKVHRSLEAVDESIANAYVAKTGMSREELLDLMNKETWMDATKAKELGFADEIMFEGEMVVTNSAGGEVIPVEVTNKIMNAFHDLISNSGDGLDVEKIKKIMGIQEGLPPIKEITEPTNKEDDTKMNMTELQEKHPELFAQISNDAQKVERDRIAELQAFADAPGATEFVKEAITNGGTVADVAIKVMEASMKRNTQEGENRKKDADASGVNKVENVATKTEQETKEERTEAAVTNMIGLVQQMTQKKGGQK